jgi:hypothetical protein
MLAQVVSSHHQRIPANGLRESDGPAPGCRCLWRLVSMVKRPSGMGWVIIEAEDNCRHHGISHQKPEKGLKEEKPLVG